MIQRKAPLIILLVAFVIVVVLIVSRPQTAPRSLEERVYPVSAQTVRYGPVRPQVFSYGEVIALREVELRTQVSGEIVAVSEKFADGGFFQTGEMMIRIDPFHYAQAVATQQANLAAAQAILSERHTAFYLAWQEAKRGEELFTRGTIAIKARDDYRANYLMSKARYNQQKAALARSEIALKQAQRNLADTNVRAPSDGYVSQVSAQIGQQISPNMRLTNFIDVKSYEVRFNISDTSYGRFLASGTSLVGLPVQLRWQVGEQTIALGARVSRQGGRIARLTRGIDLYARLDSLPPDDLRVGAFVEVVLEGKELPTAVAVPRSALFDDTQVMVIDDGRLALRQIEIAATDSRFAYVTNGVQQGEQILLTRFDAAQTGTKVEIRNQAGPQPEPQQADLPNNTEDTDSGNTSGGDE